MLHELSRRHGSSMGGSRQYGTCESCGVRITRSISDGQNHLQNGRLWVDTAGAAVCGYVAPAAPVACVTPGCVAPADVVVVIPARRESEGDRDREVPVCTIHADMILTSDTGAYVTYGR